MSFNFPLLEERIKGLYYCKNEDRYFYIQNYLRPVTYSSSIFDEVKEIHRFIRMWECDKECSEVKVLIKDEKEIKLLKKKFGNDFDPKESFWLDWDIVIDSDSWSSYKPTTYSDYRQDNPISIHFNSDEPHENCRNFYKNKKPSFFDPKYYKLNYNQLMKGFYKDFNPQYDFIITSYTCSENLGNSSMFIFLDDGPRENVSSEIMVIQDVYKLYQSTTMRELVKLISDGLVNVSNLKKLIYKEDNLLSENRLYWLKKIDD